MDARARIALLIGFSLVGFTSSARAQNNPNPVVTTTEVVTATQAAPGAPADASPASTPPPSPPPPSPPPPPPPPPAPAPPPATPSTATPVAPATPATPSPLSITGYVQGELHLQDPFTEGENPQGASNRDLFQIRRGRVKFTYTYRLADLMVELDATNRRVALQGAEVGIQIPWSDTIRSRLSIGLSIMPFGYDIQMSSKVRYFAERSLLARHFFPSERDLGALFQGYLLDSHFRYQLGVVNGSPNTDALFPAADGNGFKDVIARVSGVAGPLSFGATGYVGRGYIDGFADDANTPANEASASFQFTRYAMDLDLRFTTPLGSLGAFDIYGELAYAQNMDRLTRASYPQPMPGMGGGFGTAVVDAHQLTWYIAATQDLGHYFAVGVRAEQFDPNTAIAGDTITAVSGTALLLPTENTRIMLSYFGSKQIPDEAWVRLQVRY